jgi:hypothetical protein
MYTLLRAALILTIALLMCDRAGAQTSSDTTAAASQGLMKPEALDQLLAPIALYPDPLLATMLMASSYPLEVVQADRWLDENKTLKGEALKAAVARQGWDDSIKALAETPSVVSMMNDNLDWTQNLGDAVLAQQPDVMDAIQRLRSKAHANDKLASTKEQKVTLKREQGRQYIAIEPADDDTIYVPYYDPSSVYDPWPYSDFPPYYFPPPAYIGTGIVAGGIAFGLGYAIGWWRNGNNHWGGGFNWTNNNILANRPANINEIGSKWQHRPEHRQGVRYRNDDVARKFGDKNRVRNDAPDFRGRKGDQVLKPGADANRRAGDRSGDRGKVGKPGTANPRQATGTKGANQGKVADRRPAQRPKSGNHASRSRGKSANVHASRKANVQPAGARAGAGRSGMANVAARGGSFHGGANVRRGGGGGRGGGRRSDIAVKHDVVLLTRLCNGLGLYRFAYQGSNRPYVGVIAQEVERVMPAAVHRDDDGYLRVDYDRVGLKFRTYAQWLAEGAQTPSCQHEPSAR